MNLLLRAGALALALICVSLLPPSAFAQKVAAVGNSGTTVPLNGVGYGALGATVTPVDAAHPLPTQHAPGVYTLMTGASSAGAVALVPGIYNLQLPSAFNGATITLTIIRANGVAGTPHAFTSSVSPKLCFRVSAGETATVTVSGGTPTGATLFAGGVQCAQPVIENYAQLSLTANSAAQIATPITGMINGFVCTAPSTNTVDVLVGPSGVTTTEGGAGNGYPIIPGGSWAAGLSTTANTWFISTAAAVISCHGN